MSRSRDDEAIVEAYVQACTSENNGKFSVRAKEVAWLLRTTLHWNTLRLELLTALRKMPQHRKHSSPDTGPKSQLLNDLKDILTNVIIMQTRLNERESSLAPLLDEADLGGLVKDVALDSAEMGRWAESIADANRHIQERASKRAAGTDPAAVCYHGGAFFDAIGDEFDNLDIYREIINADVLDAWFPPAPGVTATLQEHLPWLLRTSPPTGSEGLTRRIAGARGVEPGCVLAGAGSSDLIYLAFSEWLTSASRALILDPTYGEYAHVLENVVHCKVDRLRLLREDSYDLDLARLESALGDTYDLVVLVNPNTPTGRHVARRELEEVLRLAPARTRIWIDEAYVDYAGQDQSLERFAASSDNVVVCKSMSKVYALSGVRAAYLCAAPHILGELRSVTPPWAVGLPAQVAAVMALQDPGYYADRHRETHALRSKLVEGLLSLNKMEVVPSVANFVLCHLRPEGPDAATVVELSRAHGLFLRDASGMGSQLGSHALRIAVKDAGTNRRIVGILGEVLRAG